MPSGLILKDRDDMISIVETIQSRVPACSSTTEPDQVCHSLLGGDQRVIAERKKSTNTTQEVIPVCEDWHTKLCFLMAMMDNHSLTHVNYSVFFYQSVMKLALTIISDFSQKKISLCIPRVATEEVV